MRGLVHALGTVLIVATAALCVLVQVDHVDTALTLISARAEAAR
ncbi:hypothetical protein [Nocardioides sp. URHA0020]|nr:hypothetical protein [Nocardioides sp. URHA0020]